MVGGTDENQLGPETKVEPEELAGMERKKNLIT